VYLQAASCVDFHFQHDWAMGAWRRPLFALIALQFQVSGFSFCCQSTSTFFLLFHFFFVFLLPLRLLLCFCFTGCATKRVRCCCCCCCWLSATALELIFIYISGRWFRLYLCGLQYSIPWNENKELKN